MPSSQRPDRQRPQVRLVGDRERGHRLGQRIAADQFQDDRAGHSRADPAQVRPEPVRQALGPVGEVGRGLTGHQPDRSPGRCTAAVTRPSTGSMTWPRYTGASPAIVITARQCRR